MQTVRIKRDELKAVLQKNRAEHRSLFERALEGYRKLAIAELERSLTEAKAGRQIQRALALVEPMDRTKDYDRVLRMLEMSADDIVELQEHEFQQYVMDEWGWKAQFVATNSSYAP